MGAGNTTEVPRGSSRSIADALSQCQTAVSTLSASYDMLTSAGQRHLRAAKEARASGGPDWKVRAVACMKKYKKSTEDAGNIQNKILVLERHIDMMQEQVSNTMVTSVLRHTSVAMARSSRDATVQLRRVDNANTAYTDLLDRMTDVTEALEQSSLGHETTESDALLDELLAEIGDEPNAVAEPAASASDVEAQMQTAPAVPRARDRPPPPSSAVTVAEPRAKVALNSLIL